MNTTREELLRARRRGWARAHTFRPRRCGRDYLPASDAILTLVRCGVKRIAAAVGLGRHSGLAPRVVHCTFETYQSPVHVFETALGSTEYMFATRQPKATLLGCYIQSGFGRTRGESRIA